MDGQTEAQRDFLKATEVAGSNPGIQSSGPALSAQNRTACVMSPYKAQRSSKRSGFFSVEEKAGVRLFKNLTKNTK